MVRTVGPRCAPRPLEGLRGRGQAPDHQGVAHQDGQGGQDEAGQHQHQAVDEKLVEALRAGRVVADQLAVDVVRAGEDQGGQPLDAHQCPRGGGAQQGMPAGPVGSERSGWRAARKRCTEMPASSNMLQGRLA